MALFTPTNQKRLTNISVVRLKKGGNRYELACYPNKVQAWRDKLETNLDEVLQAHCVFTNVSKGQFANKKEMYVHFCTEDERQIIKTILEHGELQLTEKERLVGQQALFRDVAKIVSERCVNPENNRAYTVTMIEKMMKDCHISLKANKSAKQHALEVIKQLRSAPGFKIAPSMMEVNITIQKDSCEPVIERLLQLCNDIIQQSESSDGLYDLTAVVEPEKYGSIETLLHNEIKVKTEVGERKVVKNVPDKNVSSQLNDNRITQSSEASVSVEKKGKNTSKRKNKKGSKQLQFCEQGFIDNIIVLNFCDDYNKYNYNMSLLRNVHHVRFATKSLWQTCKTLIKGFGFTLHCLFKCGSEINLVLKSNQSVIMLSEIKTLSSVHHPFKYHSEISNWYTKRDGPCDIALEVVDVYEVCERVSRFSGFENILLEPTTYADYDGKIVLGVIKSCVGDLLHTIVDSSQYKGLFLPGYTSGQSANDDLKEALNNNGSNPNSFVKYTDHIAIAGDIGDSDTFMNWYKTVFGMKRIFINIQDDESQGFIVKFKNTGMMLKAVCHKDPTSNSDYRNACKFVFVEPTKDSEPSQVTRFLQANSGPGLQHMGLAIDNIIDVAATCHQNGIKFITAPDVYYEAVSCLGKNSQFSCY
ncbi:unnamed protein product [Schistosoma curassoni]|nr:unnamed protein product [Schistosoma curassoni]